MLLALTYGTHEHVSGRGGALASTHGADNLLELFGWERLERGGPQVALRRDRQRQTGERLVVRGLHPDREIVLSQGHEHPNDLAAELLGELGGSPPPLGRLLNGAQALLGPVAQQQVGAQWVPPRALPRHPGAAIVALRRGWVGSGEDLGNLEQDLVGEGDAQRLGRLHVYDELERH